MARTHGCDRLQERGACESQLVHGRTRHRCRCRCRRHTREILATAQKEKREFPSGPTLTARQMVAGVKQLARDWKYDVVSIRYPGVALHNRVIVEPRNLGTGSVGFDFRRAFGRPVRVLNDAAMQAVGGYKHGEILFPGLGTGLEQAVATSSASSLPDSFRPAPARGSSLNASSRFPSTNRRLVR